MFNGERSGRTFFTKLSMVYNLNREVHPVKAEDNSKGFLEYVCLALTMRKPWGRIPCQRHVFHAVPQRTRGLIL